MAPMLRGGGGATNNVFRVRNAVLQKEYRDAEESKWLDENASME